MELSNKGWLRIVEAFIAVILITGVLIILLNQGLVKPQSSERIYSIQTAILDEISYNDSLRGFVMNKNETRISDFVSTRTPVGFNFSVKICEIGEICNLPTYKEGIYSTEKIISANLTDYNPKKIKLFMWLEE